MSSASTINKVSQDAGGSDDVAIRLADVSFAYDNEALIDENLLVASSPNAGYCMVVIRPKVDKFEKKLKEEQKQQK